LYYTGLNQLATIRERDQDPKSVQISRSYDVNLDVTVSPQSMNWYVVE
jgi:hypothetical protein